MKERIHVKVVCKLKSFYNNCKNGNNQIVTVDKETIFCKLSLKINSRTSDLLKLGDILHLNVFEAQGSGGLAKKDLLNARKMAGTSICLPCCCLSIIHPQHKEVLCYPL